MTARLVMGNIAHARIGHHVWWPGMQYVCTDKLGVSERKEVSVMSSSNKKDKAAPSLSSRLYAEYPFVVKMRSQMKGEGSATLHLILSNLIDHAVEYSINKVAPKAGRVIEVSVDHRDIVSVSDEGVGLSSIVDRKTGKRSMEIRATTSKVLADGKSEIAISEDNALLAANAASSVFHLVSQYGGFSWSQVYRHGIPEGEVKKGAATNSTGTTVKYSYDKELFTEDASYDHIRLVEKLSGLAHSHPGVKFILKFRELEEGVFYVPNIEEQMPEWVEAHGSWRLKRAVQRGYKAKGIYLRERLQSELPDIMPGFILDTNGSILHGACINPTERALRMEEEVEEKLKKKYPNISVEVVWTQNAIKWDGQVQATSVWTQSEMIKVTSLYGFNVYLPVAPSKGNPLKALMETPGVEEIWFDNFRRGFFSVAGNAYAISEVVFASGTELREFVETTINEAGHDLMQAGVGVGDFSWLVGDWYTITEEYSMRLTQHSSEESASIGFIIKLTK